MTNRQKSLIDEYSTSSSEDGDDESSQDMNNNEENMCSTSHEKSNVPQHLIQDEAANGIDSNKVKESKNSLVCDEKDHEGISLLKVIFPEASQQELEQIHYNHVSSPIREKNTYDGHTQSVESEKQHIEEHFVSNMENDVIELKDSDTPLHPTGNKAVPSRILAQAKPNQKHQIKSLKHDLPDDFLRIPQSQALKLPNKNGKMEWNIVADLEQQVIEAHMNHDEEAKLLLTKYESSSNIIVRTAVFSRDLQNGLGMQLREWRGHIFVHCLTCLNGNRINDEMSYQVALESGLPWREFGAAFEAGIKVGDQILGVNGVPFLRWGSNSIENTVNANRPFSSDQILAAAARMIRAVSDPIVLHILRNVAVQESNNLDDFQHAISFAAKNIHTDDSVSVTQSEISDLSGFSALNNNNSSSRKRIPDIHGMPKEFLRRGIIKNEKEQKRITKDIHRLVSRATIWKENSYLLTSFSSDFFIDTTHHQSYIGAFSTKFIRQALSVHIVNTFEENTRLAYTIYVFDVESKTEWYAPIRYFQDFQELRKATMNLDRAVEKLPFPSSTWFGKDEISLSRSVKEERRKQLEDFLTGLCNNMYIEKLNDSTYEIALFVQSFLGCDLNDKSIIDSDLLIDSKETDESEKLLKTAIQLHTYRLFQLSTLKTLVSRFIQDVKRRAILIEENKRVNNGSSIAEKEKIIVELVTVKHVFTNILDLIQQGSNDDFNSLATSLLDPLKTPTNLNDYIERVVRDAIREQIEIEAYVPCRSIISSLLVHGWRYDDRAITFKIAFLKQKSQSFFKIKEEHQSPSDWDSVVQILSKGVGRSTLPCNKLRAVVNSGKEIGHLYKKEHPASLGHTALGADDFLPIFIYCVVNSNIERPCALCALLKHLCDDRQQIGETGYYLSSFEATIMYIHDMDLTSIEE
ncbi:hypothetical protein CTEN210_01808 [Chaetoceros tenuissimus]|uniref:VPS9 domain-containing protein n=1 Tax=Chaetoceros tenuissimus TaxID=426638 RepID=A0AAD3H0F4_9STRA|nr:hypothetical protein CTEN210_01808 [Chaetoceros tenuissimus]